MYLLNSSDPADKNYFHKMQGDFSSFISRVYDIIVKLVMIMAISEVQTFGLYIR